MWGIFVGIVIGVLQVWALGKIGQMVLGDKAAAKLAGGLLFFVKMAAIVAVLYLISTVSLGTLIWTAGGMLLGLVLASVYILRRRKTHGKDNNNG